MYRRRKTEKDYHALAEEEGIRWIGDHLPRNVIQKTTWVCANNHKWLACFSNIKSGHGCPKCNPPGRPSKTVSDYSALAKNYDFEWTGEHLPSQASKNTSWRCRNGHQFEKSFSALKQYPTCPLCNPPGRKRKKEADYHNLARNHNFEWKDDRLPDKACVETSWRCDKGHGFEKSYTALKKRPTCPVCIAARYRRKTEVDYHALAEKHDLRWSGEVLPENITCKTLWVCKKGHHERIASYHYIKKGCICRKCYIASLNRKRLITTSLVETNVE